MANYVCHICGREFDNAYSLGSHVGWHTNGLRINPLKISMEIRTCTAPNCNITFECKVNSTRKYCCGGHNKKGIYTPVETRFCECNCGKTFECMVTSKQRFIKGHNRRKHISVETRFCECGCGGTFECRVDSNQRFLCGHGNRGKSIVRLKTPLALEVEDILSGKKEAPFCKCGCGERIIIKSHHSWAGIPEYIRGHHHRGKTYVEIYGEDRASDEFCKRLKSMQLSPNVPEMRMLSILKKVFPDEYKYVGNGEFALGGRCPDFVNIDGQKKIIEVFGDFWHEENKTGTPSILHEQERKDYFKQYEYETLVVWEHELLDEKVLISKIKKFSSNMESIKCC